MRRLHAYEESPVSFPRLETMSGRWTDAIFSVLASAVNANKDVAMETIAAQWKSAYPNQAFVAVNGARDFELQNTYLVDIRDDFKRTQLIGILKRM